MPAVSVVMPCRQAEATVQEAAESMLGQRGVDLELLAVDDGSTDATPALLKRLSARHPKLRLLRTPGVGIARALQLGCRHATGTHLARMDADDVAHPDRLHLQLEGMRADPGLGALGTCVEAFPDAHVGEGMRRYVAWQNGLLSHGDHANGLFVESPLCHPSVMLRRKALEAVGGYRDFPGPEDYELWLRMAHAGWRLAKLPQVLLGWRHRAGRSTFSDPRFARARFLETKAPFLASWLKARHRHVAIWGAGVTGKRLARALEPHGVRPARFIDVDPKKIGNRARGVRIVEPRACPRGDLVVVAVGARGARDEVRGYLNAAQRVEGRDYICAS